MPQHGQAGTKQDEQDTRLFVDGANHKRAVLCADTDRTVITLHDSGGRKLISIIAEGKDQPTIAIYKGTMRSNDPATTSTRWIQSAFIHPQKGLANRR